jgi:hypothetical protein
MVEKIASELNASAGKIQGEGVQNLQNSKSKSQIPKKFQTAKSQSTPLNADINGGQSLLTGLAPRERSKFQPWDLAVWDFFGF